MFGFHRDSRKDISQKPAQPKDANQLAEDRTEMAFDRTLLAMERTLMAWIRTAVSLISFGFTIFKFLQAMQKEGEAAVHQNAPRNMGLFLVCLGIGMLALGLLQYKKGVKRIEHLNIAGAKIPLSLAFFGACAMLLVGLFAILNMFFGFGGM